MFVITVFDSSHLGFGIKSTLTGESKQNFSQGKKIINELEAIIPLLTEIDSLSLNKRCKYFFIRISLTL